MRPLQQIPLLQRIQEIILNISDSFSEDTPRLLGKHFSNQKAEADLGQSQKAES